MKHFTTDTIREWAQTVKAGEEILLSGTIYTARDAAHKRIFAALESGAPLPFPLRDSIIYYAGPTPARNGMPTGSCGPTTSSRMDPYCPRLTALGMAATIGKGDRSPAVYEAIRTHGALYLCAIGGAGALCASAIKQIDVIAYPELGCESIKRMIIADMSLFVGIDTQGHSLFRKDLP